MIMLQSELIIGLVCMMAGHTLFATLFFVSLSGATPPPPLHSTVISNGIWECNEGYYRSTPSLDPDSMAVIFNTVEPLFLLQTDFLVSPLLPFLQATCVPCTSPLLKPCAIGWQIAACTRTMDTTCIPCPTLISPEKKYTVEGSCDTFGCALGYYQSSGMQCKPCPKGSYCPLLVNLPILCGPFCTTLFQGCDSALQCVQSETSSSSSYFLSVSYSIASFIPLLLVDITKNSNDEDNNPLNLTSTSVLYNFNSNCPLFVTSWSRPYALMQGCFLDMSSSSITCYLSVPRCVVEDVLQWLMRQIDNEAIGNQNADTTTTILSKCLFARAPLIFMGQPLIKVDVQLPDFYFYSDNHSNTIDLGPKNNASTQKKPGINTDIPALVVERRIWGQTKGEYLFTFLLISGILMGLTMGLTAACALAYIRRSRNRTVDSNFNELSFKHHRFFLKRNSKGAAPRLTTTNHHDDTNNKAHHASNDKKNISTIITTQKNAFVPHGTDHRFPKPVPAVVTKLSIPSLHKTKHKV
jgi:hypothetical protein